MQCRVVFYDDYCIIHENKSGEIKGIGKGEHGLYYLLNENIGESVKKIRRERRKVVALTANTCSKIPSTLRGVPKLGKSTLWHHRLGHAPMKRIALIKDLGVNKECDDVCLACPLAKFTKLPFTKSESQTDEIFKLVHMDTWGPYKVSYKGRFRYFLTLVDDCSRVTWIHLLKVKSDAFTAIESFVNMAKTQFEKEVKVIRSDNALEFDDKKCRPFFEKLGIIHQTSCSDTPQQNGRVERRHRNILEMARALRFQAGLPLHFWGDCVMAATHITNRLPSVVLEGKNPYEVLYGKAPVYSHLKCFGCLAFAYNPERKHDKFQARGVPCIFLGYPSTQKGYKLHNLLTGISFVSRHVKFYEAVYPYHIFHTANVNEDTEKENSPVYQPIWVDETENAERESSESEQDTHMDPPIMVPSPRRSTREVQKPSWHSDYEFRVNMAHRVGHTDVSTEYCCFMNTLSKVNDPKSFREAAQCSHWLKAMNEELEALEENNTWIITELPEGKRAIGCKWLYTTKYDPQRKDTRYKSRLVILGNKQQYGVDYMGRHLPQLQS